MIVDAPIERDVRAAFLRERGHFCSAGEKQALERYMIPSSGKGINPAVVGQPPQEIARRAGFQIASDRKLLLVELTEVGPSDPLSREKLCPVLGYFVDDGWEACCRRAIALLRYGGVGHSLGLHSRDAQVIERFFQEKPAFRIIVNSNTAIGAVGYTTGFAPAMTLGPGSWGGSITSDNITPLHLINIKRIGEEVRPYHDPLRDAPGGAASVLSPPTAKGLPTQASENTPLAAMEIRGIVESFLAEFRSRRSSR